MTFVTHLGDWRALGGPLGGALAAAVRNAVLDGAVPVGSPLPSERALAHELQISRGTVVAALAALRDSGWIGTRHGSGSVVRLPPHLAARTAPWSLDHGGDVELDLTQAVPAAPYRAYLAAARRAVERSAALLVDAGTPTAGLPQLRELLAARHTAEGQATAPEQILVTSGATAALTLLVGHLAADRRRPVLVENPTWPGALTVLRRSGAPLRGMPVGAGTWDRVVHAVGTGHASMAYLTPDFHNPTGLLMPDEVRRRVAATAGRAGVPVVADETMRDLDLRTPAPAVPHLSGPTVVTIGSTSKVIWSGLRVGWIRASRGFIRELLRQPLPAGLSPPPLEQLIALELLSGVGGDGTDQILRDRRARLRVQRDHLVGLLERYDDWSFTVPPGGLTLWLRLHHRTGPELAARARSRGLALTPGPQFSVDRTLTHHLRLPFTPPPQVLDRAVELLLMAGTDHGVT